MTELIRFAVPNDLRILQILRKAGYALPTPIGLDGRIGVANGIEFSLQGQVNISSLVQRGAFDAGITGVNEGLELVTEDISWRTIMSPVSWWRVGLQVCYAPGLSQQVGKRRQVAKLEAAARAYLQAERQAVVRFLLPQEQRQALGNLVTIRKSPRASWLSGEVTVAFSELGEKVVTLLNHGARCITVAAAGQVDYCRSY